jgi:ankyrin repeat protein
LYGYLPVVKALLSGGVDVLTENNDGYLPIHLAVRREKSAVAKCLLQHFYATTRRLPLHELVEYLTWIKNPNPNNIDVPPLRAALHQDVLSTDDVVEIVEFLVACHRGAAFTIVQSLVNLYKASVKSLTSEGDLPLFLACEMPETSLNTIFFLMKLYPDLVYR